MSTKTKHTPGPWMIYQCPTMVHQFQVNTGKEMVTIPTTSANARLIAAAPDFLAFAEMVLANAKARPDERGWFAIGKDAETLIAKARGES